MFCLDKIQSLKFIPITILLLVVSTAFPALSQDSEVLGLSLLLREEGINTNSVNWNKVNRICSDRRDDSYHYNRCRFSAAVTEQKYISDKKQCVTSANNNDCMKKRGWINPRDWTAGRQEIKEQISE